MSDFQKYRRTQIAEIRQYEPGEILSDRVSISAADRDAGSPKAGDMIARNPKNHDDQWLIAADYFADNFATAETSDQVVELVSKIDLRFRSGNSVPVERAFLSAVEWEKISNILVMCNPEETDRCDDLRDRMDNLLTSTANALKGEPEPDSLHSWHDLPEFALTAVATIGKMELEKQALESKIDSLMLEYCQDEMTPEQLERWASHQRRADPEEEAAINAAIREDIADLDAAIARERGKAKNS